ncbi:MAG: CHAT domain-containing protein [Spirulina sp. SIO3F2]|nr:CHAT domain-containing protein [Spirulina sp. SIO3F2]
MQRFRVVRWLLLVVGVALLMVGGRSLSAQSVIAIQFEPQLAVEQGRLVEEIVQASESELFDEALDWIIAAEQSYQQGDFIAASAKIGEAIHQLKALSPSVDQQDMLALSLDLSGAISFDRSQFAEALIAWQEAADIYDVLSGTEAKDHFRQNLVNQARALQSNGQFEQACETLLRNVDLENSSCEAVSRAIVQYQDGGNLKPNEAVIIDRLIHHLATDLIDVHTRLNLGDVLRKGGYFEAAMKVLVDLKETAFELSTEDQGEILLALANTVRSQGDSQRAQAAASLGIQFSANFCPSLNNIKQSGDWPGFYNTAIDAYNAIYETFSWESEVGLKAWISWANLKLALKGLDKKTIFMHSLTPAQLSNPRLQESLLSYAQLLRCYAQAVRDAGNPKSPKATPLASWQRLFLDYLQQATNLVETIVATNQIQGNTQFLSYGYGYLGEFKEFEYNTLNSANLARKSELEQSPLLIAARGLTQQALEHAGDSALLRYQWLWQMGRILRLAPPEKSTFKALDYYQSAYAALQSLRNNLVAFNQSIQYDFRDRVEPLYREYVGLLLETEEHQKSIQQKNLKEARDVIETLQLAELENFFRDRCTTFTKQSVADFDPHAIVIYPVISQKSLTTILELPNQDNLVSKTYHFGKDSTFENVQSFEAGVNDLIEKVSLGDASFSDLEQASEKIYDFVLKKNRQAIERSGKIETLIFVSDGVLRNLPPAVLFDGQHFLIESYAIVVSPGLQLVDNAPKPEKRYQAILAGASNAPSFGQLDELSNAVAEINDIHTILSDSGHQVYPLVNEAFTRSGLETVVAERSINLAHFASHARFSSNPDNTYILDWSDKISTKSLEQLLRGQANLTENPLELLVLSACETATGDKRATLGLAGVAIRAGSKSTIASLWKVADYATAEFMRQLYEQLTQFPEISKAEALRRVQVAFYQQGFNETEDEEGEIYDNPYYWSAFTLVGNWL